jgi:hypothetical protein
MGCSHSQNLLTQADLMPPPDDGAEQCVEVPICMTSIEAYGCGYVAIAAQLLVSLLDGEDHRDFL